MASTNNQALNAYLKQRYLDTGELLTTFNPERLEVHGSDAPGLGADPATTGPAYVFVTTPDLNLFSPDDGSIIAAQLGIGSPVAPVEIAKLLTGGSGFIKLLTNTADPASLSDVVLDTMTVGDGWDGVKMTVPKNAVNSRQSGTLQVEYDEYVGTPITLLHKLWIDYVDAVTRGTLFPKTGHIVNRVVDFMASIYVVQCLNDGETIQMMARYTGVTPTAQPFSAFKGVRGNSERVKVTVPYAYSFYEVMDNVLFSEFNVASAGTGVSIEGASTSPTNQGGTKVAGGRLVYRLKFTGHKSTSAFSPATAAKSPISKKR